MANQEVPRTGETPVTQSERVCVGRRYTPGRRRSQRGAGMVEFALLLPVFMMLVFGTFSGAQAYNQKLTLVAAAREATRYGATLPINPSATTDNCSTPKSMTTWLGCVEQAAVQTATGQLATTTSGRSICVAYVNGTGTGTSTTSATYTTSDTTYTSGTTACDTSTASGAEPQVQVVVKNNASFNVILWSSTIQVSGSSVSRYEKTS